MRPETLALYHQATQALSEGLDRNVLTLASPADWIEQVADHTVAQVRPSRLIVLLLENPGWLDRPVYRALPNPEQGSLLAITVTAIITQLLQQELTAHLTQFYHDWAKHAPPG